MGGQLRGLPVSTDAGCWADVVDCSPKWSLLPHFASNQLCGAYCPSGSVKGTVSGARVLLRAGAAWLRLTAYKTQLQWQLRWSP